jgi:hypothetical protein
VIYSAPSSKIIISMNSPWLELSNGILFAIFHYRLTHFPFSVCFSVENRVPVVEIYSNGEGDGPSISVGPSSSEGNGGERWR